MTEPSSHASLPEAKDTRLLIAGIAASLALVVYLGVAFVNTHATNGLLPSEANKVAPWTPASATLTPIPVSHGRYVVRVTPATKGPTYGAVAQTLVPDPTRGARYVVELWLRGARPGRIGVELNEYRPGVAKYPVETTVPATAKWRRFTFSTRMKGTWLGLAVYVYRPTRRGTWFAIRRVTAVTGGR